MYIVYPHFTRLFKPSKKDKDSVEDKGRRCGLGDIIVSILALLQLFCTRTIWRMGWLILFLKSFWCKIASTARNWINSVPQTTATTFAFSSVFILLLWFSPWMIAGPGVPDFIPILDFKFPRIAVSWRSPDLPSASCCNTAAYTPAALALLLARMTASF